MKHKNKFEFRQFIRFLIGGGSGVFTDYIVYRLLTQEGISISAAKGISYICGAIVGFIINKWWTFESRSFSKAEILRYVILYAISAYVNAGVNNVIILLCGIPFPAFLCATGVSTVLNFLGQKFFVFVKKETHK